MPALGRPAGWATYAGKTNPSADLRSMKLPMSVSCSAVMRRRGCSLTAGFLQETNVEQVLLVTGASRGIGAATALLAARKGYAVAVNYAANSAAADAVVGEIRAAGGKAIALQADVAREEQVLAMFEQVD